MRRIFKLLSCILVIVILSINLISCFNYTEINKITFATSMIFDIDDNDNIIIYLDCIRPYRSENESSDKGKKVMFQGSGKTCFEALSSIKDYSNNKLKFSQIRAYIFTENAAKKGLEKYINLINSNKEFGYKPYMFVYYGDINQIVNPDTKDSEEQDYLGTYLEQLESINKNNMNTVNTNINDYDVNKLEGNKNVFLSSIEVKKDNIDQKISLCGATLINNNKYIESLSSKEVAYLNLLTKSMNEGIFILDNPNSKNDYISLEIIKNRIHNNISIDKDIININKNIELILAVREIQDQLSINDNTIEYLQISQKKKLQEDMHQFLEKYSDKNIDILNIQKNIEQKGINYNDSSYLDKTNINLNIDIKIRNANMTKNSI